MSSQILHVSGAPRICGFFFDLGASDKNDAELDILGKAKERINRDAVQKAVDDTKEILESLSYQLQQSRLT